MMHSAAGGLWFEDAQFGIALRSTGSARTGTYRMPRRTIHRACDDGDSGRAAGTVDPGVGPGTCRMTNSVSGRGSGRIPGAPRVSDFMNHAMDVRDPIGAFVQRGR